MIDAVDTRPVSMSPHPSQSQTSRTPMSRATSNHRKRHEIQANAIQATKSPEQTPDHVISSRASTVSSTDRRTTNIFEFESSDDDIPLARNDNLRRTPTSSVPAPIEKPSSRLASPENRPTPPRRPLRTRKPEQQMPYTLDLIRHRDQFRRRGLKPVHNPAENLPLPVHKADDEQYQADDDEGEEGQLAKYELYIPPKDAQERAPKRRRIEGRQNGQEGQRGWAESAFEV